MSERNIAWAVRLGASVTLLVLLCVVTPVYLWIRAHGEIDGTAALTFAIVLPLTITPTLSVIMLRTRLKVYRLAEENFRIAHMDELTGLPNRRAFFEGARQLQARADFTQRLFFCAIADVDDFKRVNDTRGHDVGDHVLREIAALLNTRAPDDCIVARLGGEEFALAGIFASEAEASEAFDRLVAQVAAASVQIEGGRLSVTISLGYCRGHRLNEISTLLSRADRALYVAKNFGKNRVMSYEAAAKSEADAA
tara:strand:+ start:286 stop:1041 length:756 start_codon:yes stop_codon:yes gene_type:complete